MAAAAADVCVCVRARACAYVIKRGDNFPKVLMLAYVVVYRFAWNDCCVAGDFCFTFLLRVACTYRSSPRLSKDGGLPVAITMQMFLAILVFVCRVPANSSHHD